MILRDRFGRNFDYLRISLTDRCNLRCFYCMPEEGIRLFDKKEILSLEEIEYLVYFFNKNFGISKIRFTGGEPLLRRGFENLVKNIRKNISNLDLNITTNGIMLKEKARFLKEEGIKVNVSLDTLREENFKKITGFYSLKNIIEGIDYSLSLNIPLKINTVIFKNINEDEIFDLIDFAFKRGILIRFIEFMPLSGNEWKKYFVSEGEIRGRIEERYELILKEKGKVAKIYEVYDKNKKGKFIGGIGFISTISHPFCDNCSRLRITSNGGIVLCLFDKRGYDIKKFLRPEIKEKELIDFIFKIVKLKPKGFIELRDRFLNSKSIYKPYIVMRKLGG